MQIQLKEFDPFPAAETGEKACLLIQVIQLLVHLDAGFLQVEAAHFILLLLQNLAILGLPVILNVLEMLDTLPKPTYSVD